MAICRTLPKGVRLPFPTLAEGAGWRPLLQGAVADAAQAAVERIAAALPEMAISEASSPAAVASLAGGRAGQALFWAYRALINEDATAADRADACLDEALDALVEAPAAATLYSGFAGPAWVSEHLEGRLYDADSEEDLNAEVDQTLVELIRGEGPWGRHFDLVSGLAGLGLYALERFPRSSAARILEGVVARFAETAEPQPRGITWRTARELLPESRRATFSQGALDLGLAHGAAGVLPVLAGACRVGVAEETARPLLDDAVHWLLAQALEDWGTGRFPAWIAEEEPLRRTRLAWCYGDAGISAALLWTARLVDEPGWEEAALEIARGAAARSEESSGVRDAGLCHGAAGLGHLFNRLYQATGDEDLGEAARFWFERTLSRYFAETSLSGFLSWQPQGGHEGEWVETPAFLTGAAGVGLALTAAVSSLSPDWDRVLLIAVDPI